MPQPLVRPFPPEPQLHDGFRVTLSAARRPGVHAPDWAFAYDGDGTRTYTLYTPYIDGVVQTAVLTAYFMGGAYEFTGGAIRKYYSIAGMMIAMRDADGLKFPLTDHLGSIVAITDVNASIMSEQRYLPFGEVREDTGTIANTDFGYTGQRDLGMGLMDYRARFYSASLGRFVQPDSLIPNPSDPQSWARFAYVQNNPSDL